VYYDPYKSPQRQRISNSPSSFFIAVNQYVDEGYLYYPTNHEISVNDVREYFEHQTLGLVQILWGKTW